MSGLVKGNSNGNYVTIREGKVVKKTKEGSTWVVLDKNKFDALIGYVRDVNVLEREYQGEAYKEFQVIVDAPVKNEFERFILSYPLFKNFTDGLILALANSDFSREIKISPYIGDKKREGQKATTFCALRYSGQSEMIPWISGVPAVGDIKLPDGKIHKDRSEKNKFIENLVDDIKSRLTELNKDLNVNLVSKENTSDEEELGEDTDM